MPKSERAILVLRSFFVKNKLNDTIKILDLAVCFCFNY